MMGKETNIILGMKYVVGSENCINCEFEPPCLICGYVGREEIYDDWDESRVPDGSKRKDHIARKRKMVKGLYRKERGVDSRDVIVL